MFNGFCMHRNDTGCHSLLWQQHHRWNFELHMQPYRRVSRLFVPNGHAYHRCCWLQQIKFAISKSMHWFVNADKCSWWVIYVFFCARAPVFVRLHSHAAIWLAIRVCILAVKRSSFATLHSKLYKCRIIVGIFYVPVHAIWIALLSLLFVVIFWRNIRLILFSGVHFLSFSRIRMHHVFLMCVVVIVAVGSQFIASCVYFYLELSQAWAVVRARTNALCICPHINWIKLNSVCAWTRKKNANIFFFLLSFICSVLFRVQPAVNMSIHICVHRERCGIKDHVDRDMRAHKRTHAHHL